MICRAQIRSLARLVAGEGERRGGCVFLQPPRRAGEGAACVGVPGGFYFFSDFLAQENWQDVEESSENRDGLSSVLNALR
jgi:hypothetical protein